MLARAAGAQTYFNLQSLIHGHVFAAFDIHLLFFLPFSVTRQKALFIIHYFFLTLISAPAVETEFSLKTYFQ